MRSLLIYWKPGRQYGLRNFYKDLVAEGDLVFDIGSHLGDRSSAFARLGAEVVSIEPQPEVNKWLKKIVGRNPQITIRKVAVGSSPGTIELSVSQLTPTVSTVAGSWKDKIVDVNPTFSWVKWDHKITTRVVTLDNLIAKYGVPNYCKIDVEGHELEVLKGLTHDLELISFEFVYGDVKSAISCVQYLEGLGSYEYNFVLGESKKFQLEEWVDSKMMKQLLVLEKSSSGDLYARLIEKNDTGRETWLKSGHA